MFKQEVTQEAILLNLLDIHVIRQKLSQKNVKEALQDDLWIKVMQDELGILSNLVKQSIQQSTEASLEVFYT